MLDKAADCRGNTGTRILQVRRTGVSPIEFGFISTLADGLNIADEEYTIIETFVLNYIENTPHYHNLLIINEKRTSVLRGKAYV